MSRVTTIVLSVLAVIIILVVAFAALTEEPIGCRVCHDENTIVNSWAKTPMGKADIDCLDCHSDPGFVGHLKAHLHGITYLFAGTRTVKADVPQARCLQCHFSYKTDSDRQVAADHYTSYMKQTDKCGDCHFQGSHLVLNSKRVPKTVADGWAGVDVCMKCHPDKYADWLNNSLHATAMDALQPDNVGNKNCIGCHTVGYKKNGFVSMAATPKLANVQCENCHGKGGKHIATPREANSPKASLGADMCGTCHSGSHHNTFSDAEWKGTKHAAALKTLVDLNKKTPGAAQDACLNCHSADYILAPDNEKPTLKTAKYAITCAACHDGHSTATRLPAIQLCTRCHTGEGLKVGMQAHHPTREMFLGKFIPGTGIFNPPTTKHVANGIGCPSCHMSKSPFVSEAQPAKTGHDFLPKPEACVPCHPDRTAEQNDALITQIQAPTVAGLAELKPRVDAAKAKYKTLSNNGKTKVKASIKQPYDLLTMGFDFVDQDGSQGFHNPEYAAKMLDLCRTNLPIFEAAVK
jgi:hypothetical protein